MEKDQKDKKINKIIKFPENKMKRPWLRKLRNLDKEFFIRFTFSLASLIVGLAITWFILHRINS